MKRKRPKPMRYFSWQRINRNIAGWSQRGDVFGICCSTSVDHPFIRGVRSKRNVAAPHYLYGKQKPLTGIIDL